MPPLSRPRPPTARLAAFRRLELAGLAAVFLLTAGLPAGAVPKVRLTSPRPGEVAAGPSLLRAEGTGVPGEKVQFYVDGKLAGTDAEPPFEVPFDFGESLAARRVRALLTGPGGEQAADEVVTRALDPNRVDQVARVDLVNLYVTVRDHDGVIVPGLAEGDFRVTEDGKPQKLSHFSSERQPLVVGLVLDSSLSMKQEDRIVAAREAATRFLTGLRPGDRALVICFSEGVKIEQPLTDDQAALAGAIARCEPGGGTALYDALYQGAGTLSAVDGRKVLVLLSDGRDEAASGLEPGSLHTLEEAVDKTLRSEVIVYAVGVGKNLDKEMDFFGRQPLVSILDKVASSTGGRLLLLKRPSQVREAFEEVQEELRLQYNLAYAPADLRRDGAWRAIKVQVQRPGLNAQTRSGYFAPKR